MKNSLYISLAGLLLSGSVLANVEPEQAVTEAAVQPLPAVEAPVEKSGIGDAYAHVSEKVTTTVRAMKKKLQEKGQAQSKFVMSGVALVAVPSTDSDWGTARTVAYREAQMKAREDLVKQLYSEVVSKLERESFRTNKKAAFTPEELQTGKLDSMLDKVVAITDAKLDNVLEELGVDPSQYKASPPEKRKLMMKKGMSNTVERRSRGEISGAAVFKSVEATDENGNTAVGVILVTSQKLKSQLAMLRASKGQVEAVPSKAKVSIIDYLEQNESKLMYMVGARVMWDEQGYPVIVAFGQDGNSCNPLDYEACVDEREFSVINAENEAWAQLAELYNLNASVTSSSAKGKEKTKVDVVRQVEGGGTESTEETVTRIIKETRQMAEMTSRVKNLVGVETVTNWTRKHPETGREINGVVLAWHPMREAATRTFKSGKSPEAQRKAKEKKSVPGGGTHESDSMDMDDF